jgi:hypothetical protein
MESADQFCGEVSLRDGSGVEVSVPSGCNVSRLKDVIRGELELTERLTERLIETELHSISQRRGGAQRDRRGQGRGESRRQSTAYRPGQLLSAILGEGVGVDDTYPILVRITQQGIYYLTTYVFNYTTHV